MKQRKKIPIVGAVMTSFPYFVGADDPVAKLEAMMDDHGIRHLPVQENGKLVGIVSERDLHHRVSRDAVIDLKANLRARRHDRRSVRRQFSHPFERSRVADGAAAHRIGNYLAAREISRDTFRP